jgi:flagellar basal-body rod modification protein FlgD
MIQSVSPFATTPKTTAGPGSTLGKDDFLKLLITQLRNQDPLNPLDQNQFLAQTAQFSALESLQNIGVQISDLRQLAAGTSFAQSAALLGKTVLASGRDFVLGAGPALLPFVLDQTASVTVEILDARGAVVRSLASGSLPAGPQAVEWDGRDGSGTALTPGSYHFRVRAEGGATAVAAQGTLTGLSPGGGGVLYRIGNVTIRPEDLIDIR